MAFDAHKNLAISTVATAPGAPTAGTALSVTTGEGGRFPAPPFNATVWPATQPPTPANAELVRVTAIAGDAFTITRAVEGTTARSIVAGDLIAETITAKALTDIESGVNFPLITVAGGVTTGGNVLFSKTGDAFIATATADGADTRSVTLGGGGPDVGGTARANRGGQVSVYGNDYAGFPGNINIQAGTVAGPNGKIIFQTFDTTRGVMHSSGGFSWGGSVDPNAGQFSVGAQGFGVGNAFTLLNGGGIFLGQTGTTQQTVAYFYNANGQVGSIVVNGAATGFLTSSDQRIKTDRGLLTDPEVLRSTRVHHFTWNTDGTSGRGVFAQEAIAVLPSAVSIGTDERDEQGNLKQPWGVDYSKYVPDLIAGWQHHDAMIKELAAAYSALQAAEASRPSVPPYQSPHGGSMMFGRVREWVRVWLGAWRPSWV